MTQVAATPTTGQRWGTLLICCCALFMVSIDNTILNVALPSMQRELQAPVAGLQWTVDAYILVRGVTLFASGSTGDRYGRRRLFRVGLWMFTLASLACSLAPSLGVLIVFRCVQAVGGALMTPSSLAIVANTFTERTQRAQAIGFWSATNGISMAAGPILGGLLVETVGWPSVFWVNLPVGALVLVATRWLPESKAEQPRPLDPAGQFLLALTLGALTYALIDAPRAGWASTTVLALFSLTAVAAAAFVAVERSRPFPMLPLGHLGDRGLVGATVLATITYIGLGGFLFFNTLYLQVLRGFSPVMSGLLTAPTTMATLVLAPLSGRLTGVRGARLPATVASVLIATSMVVLSLVSRPDASVAQLLGGYLLLGLGVGMVNAPITNAAVSAMPPSLAGVASATTSTARQVGISMGVALLGSVVFSVAGPVVTPATAAAFSRGLSHAYLLVASLAVAAAVFAAAVFKRHGAPGHSRPPDRRTH